MRTPRLPDLRPAGPALLLAALFTLGASNGDRLGRHAAPPFATDARAWIGPPQTWDSLRGRVVLLNIWTFG